MNKLLALLLIALAASPAEPSVMGLRRPRFFGLSSWFGGSGTEETTELPVPDLTAHPLWKVHKYKGISLHPVTLPLEGGSASPASLVLPPPSAKFPYSSPVPAYGPPAPTYGPPASTYGPPATTYGLPAPTYGPPATTYGYPGQTSVSESSSSASSTDVSQGLDALGALASLIPDGESGGDVGIGQGKGAKNSLLQSTLKSVLDIKGNLGTAITGIASGKSAALSSLMNGGGQAALFGLLAQYPQLASFLARKHGAKGGDHDMPKLPDLPEVPFISGMDVIPELPELPEMKVPATYGPPAPLDPYPPPSRPAPEYGLPSGSFGSSIASAAAVTRVPETTYGVPTIPEPRRPHTTYGVPPGLAGLQNADSDASTNVFQMATAPSLLPPTSFSSRIEQPANRQADLYTTVRFNNQNSPDMNAIGQPTARNSDTTKESYVESSRFRPSTQLGPSDSEVAGSSFFPVARDYVSPFVQYRDEDPSAEASVREEETVPAEEFEDEDAEYDEPAPETIATPVVQTKLREFPVTATRAAFSDRFRGGNVHMANGEVTIDTAMRVQG